MPPWNAYTLADIEAGTLTANYRAQIRMRQATRELSQAAERLAIAMNEAFGKLATGREPPAAAQATTLQGLTGGCMLAA